VPSAVHRSTGQPLTEPAAAADIEALVERTRQGGRRSSPAQDRSAYYAPSAAAAPDGPCRGRGRRRGHAGLRLGGRQYGISGVYLGVEAEIERVGCAPDRGTGPHRQELAALRAAAEAVRAKQADVAAL
jgi:malate dehydrogenase